MDEIKVTFPYSAVLYLRGTKKTPDRMLVQIEVPGDSARYYVPIAKIVKYSIYMKWYVSPMGVGYGELLENVGLRLLQSLQSLGMGAEWYQPKSHRL